MNYIFLLVAIVIAPALFFIFKKIFKNRPDWILKSFSLLLAVVFFIRYYAVSGSLFNDCLNLSHNNPFNSSFMCFSVVVLVWLSFASFVILAILPFFKYRVLKNLAKTFCLIVNTFNVGYLNQIVYSFTGSYELSLCGAFIAIEVGLSLFYSFYILITDGL